MPLVRRVIRGRETWVMQAPPCPAGHDGQMRPGWRLCDDCGHACSHWDCTTCDASVREPDHECRR